MTLALGLLLCSHSVRERNGGRPVSKDING